MKDADARGHEMRHPSGRTSGRLHVTAREEPPRHPRHAAGADTHPRAQKTGAPHPRVARENSPHPRQTAGPHPRHGPRQ
ncbi:hypothetical protein PVT71_28165 (plasmid) [Salipiger sp. H15]|uniref:Uncharacterized protein n=1 Tax=Alloyangia sp. H15 TaxID=3029062 RepID=A0AAU8ASV9_9RHOB